MKKINFILSLFLLSNVSIQAQDMFFNDSLIKCLKKHLIEKNIVNDSTFYNHGNMIVRNLINGENIDSYHSEVDYKYGIYSFYGLETPTYYEVLIRRGYDYEILGMVGRNFSFMEIITELIAYFDRHPDVPKELFQLYVDAVSQVYYLNTHWEGAFNALKKRNISEYGTLSKDAIYRIIEDSEGQIEFFVD